MQVQNVELKKLKPWEKNPCINDHAVVTVVKSIEEFGFNVPILCDPNFTIIAGHTRMINCLDCGFCMVQCFHARHFNRNSQKLELTNCLKCGQCINLKFYMGWKHRFWRRIIVER